MRARQRRLRARDLEPALLPLAALAVWLLGYWGERSLVHDTPDPLNAAYRALELFTMESLGETPPIPPQLHVARLLAPLILGYAAIRGLLLLARGEVGRWRTRLFARGHVVVVGDSPTAEAVAAHVRRTDTRTVLVADDSAHDGEGTDIAVFPGPVTDAAAIGQTRLDRASDVVVATGDDDRNLDAMGAVQRTLDGADRRPLVHVELADARLWRELHSLSLTAAGRRAPVEFFNLADREARVLLEGVADVLAGGDPEAPLLVAADERSEVALVSHVLRRRPRPTGRARIALLSDEAAEQHRRLLEHVPWVDEQASLFEIDPDALRTGTAPGLATTELVLVCHRDPAPALITALAARSLPRAAIAVSISDPHLRDALAGAGFDLRSLRLVPTQPAAIAALFDESAIELIARAKHDDYLARELAEGRTAQDNPSAVPWPDLPESLRESNRQFARSVADKLAELDARIAPLRALSPPDELALDEDRLEDLARGEHDRWMRDQVADGWRHTTGAKDAERRLHPLLVPWEELPEPDREKDRDAYRALPAMLARAGYEIVTPERTD